jgi:hypothetical protein
MTAPVARRLLGEFVHAECRRCPASHYIYGETIRKTV